MEAQLYKRLEKIERLLQTLIGEHEALEAENTRLRELIVSMACTADGGDKQARDCERLNRLTDERTADEFATLAKWFRIIRNDAGDVLEDIDAFLKGERE